MGLWKKSRQLAAPLDDVFHFAGGLASGAVGKVTDLLHTPLHLPGLGRGKGKHPRGKPGERPGIEHLPEASKPPEPDQIRITCTDFGQSRHETRPVTDLQAFFQSPRPEWATVRWINVDGLHPYIVKQFQDHLGFHTLAAEDTLHTGQRARMEPYDGYLYLVTRMVMLQDKKLTVEQVSFFYYNDLLLTFQETQGDVWDPIRERIRTDNSRLRENKAGYLLYALLDAVVDHAFPILEKYGDSLEAIEMKLLLSPSNAMLNAIHRIKRDLMVLRRVLWPTRQMIDDLRRDETQMLSGNTETYLRDVYEHIVEIIDIIETYRELAGGLTDLHMSSVSNRMNEVMKVLTIMASLFIPITFFAGVYGMNFDHIPELHWYYAYPIFWGVCGITVIGLLWFFKRKGWIG